MNQAKTDRILIAVALLIFLIAIGLFHFDSWMWGNRRSSGERIGVIAAHSGDVRMKYEGDIKWQKASSGEELMYNDSVYAGSESEAKLKLGESEMTVTQNTLVVLRREEDASFLNLNYGTMFGKVAGSDKIFIDTGSGKPLEISTTGTSEIVLKKVGGQTELEVVGGKGNLKINGKELTNKKVVLADATDKQQRARLQILKPLSQGPIFSEEPIEVPFEWQWTADHKVSDQDLYRLEFSSSPYFKAIHKVKPVKGKMNTALNVRESLSLYFRVRGPEGDLSEVQQVRFQRMHRPLIIQPNHLTRTTAFPGEQVPVKLVFQRDNKASIWYQIAKDEEFTDIMINENTTRLDLEHPFAIGQYFLRARSDYGDGHNTGWSETVPFSVDLRLREQKSQVIQLLSKVLVPNQNYPAGLYGASSAKVREYLATHGFLQNYFPFSPDTFDQLQIQFENGDRELATQNNRVWPNTRLRPGRFDFRYQITKEGYRPSGWSPKQRLEIAMEPPRASGQAEFGPSDSAKTREVSWNFTPLLFARSYDVEVSVGDPTFSKTIDLRVNNASVKTRLPANRISFWRVRARDAQGRLISDYSQVYPLQPPAEVPQYLAEEDEDRTRYIAQDGTTSTRVERFRALPYTKNGWWAWLGAGANYLDYRQSTPGIGSVRFAEMAYPTQYFEGGYAGDQGYGGVFTYKSTPGDVDIKSTSVPLDKTHYNWTTFSLEGVRRAPSPLVVMNSPVVVGIRMGVQQHQMPFLSLNTGDPDDDEDNSLTLNELNLMTASAGLLAEWGKSKWTYYWLMRYQYPLSSQSSSGTIEVDPTFEFDGSVGTSYNFTKAMKVGLFWYGQWHQYNFTNKRTDGSTNSGFQSLFYSNVDFRLGVDF